MKKVIIIAGTIIVVLFCIFKDIKIDSLSNKLQEFTVKALWCTGGGIIVLSVILLIVFFLKKR